jgi:hypothetical protein
MGFDSESRHIVALFGLNNQKFNTFDNLEFICRLADL